MKAFIFSSLADRKMAHFCQDRLRRQGVDSLIVLDSNDGIEQAESGEIITDFPRRGRLFGAACSVGIARTMAEHADGHSVIAKVDADCWFSEQGIHWLSGVQSKARGFRIAAHSWLGIWSATSDAMQRAAERIDRASKCTGCAESSIFRSYFQRFCGRETAPYNAVQTWRAGRPIRPDTWLATFPSGMTAEQRQSEGAELFFGEKRNLITKAIFLQCSQEMQ
jgi:hypothetical protein